MTDDSTRLADARRVRDEAREIVVADLRELKGGYAPQGLVDRARERVSDEVHGLLDEAKDLVGNSKPIIAVMVVALAGWFARHRLLALWHWITGANDSAEPEEDSGWEED